MIIALNHHVSLRQTRQRPMEIRDINRAVPMRRRADAGRVSDERRAWIDQVFRDTRWRRARARVFQQVDCAAGGIVIADMILSPGRYGRQIGRAAQDVELKKDIAAQGAGV